MTRAEFRRRWRRDVRQAGDTLIREGHLAPLVAVVGRDGGLHLVAPDFRDEAAKARAITAARLTAVAVDAVYVMLRCEVWAVTGDLPADVAPADSDRRTEAVLVAASARVVGGGVEHLSRLVGIERGGDGRPVGLRDLRAGRGGPDLAATGWVADLLPPLRPTEEQRGLAALLVTEMRRRG